MPPIVRSSSPRRGRVALIAALAGSLGLVAALRAGGPPAAVVALDYEVEVLDAEQAVLGVRLRIEGTTPAIARLGFSSNSVERHAPASKFRVRGARRGGAALEIARTPGEWTLRGPRGDRLEVDYEVHLERGRSDSPYAEVALSRLDAGGGRLLGSDVFLFPTDRAPSSIEVRYALPPGWGLWHPFQTSDTTAAPPTLRSLYYSAVAIGEHRHLRRQVRGAEIEIAVRGRYAFGDDDLMEVISEIADHQLEFFGSTPRPRYLFVVEPHPRDDDPQVLRYFGLHFDASMIVLLDPRTDRHRLQAEPAGLCAHEFFHNWVGEQLRQEDASTNWFVEGVTTLYAARTRMATRMLDPGTWSKDLRERYASAWADEPIREEFTVAAAGQRVLEDSALTRMLYTGGLFVALALDERMLAASRGAVGLDDLVRALVARAASEPGFALTRAALEAEYAALTGEDLGPWLDRHVYGQQELPLPEYVTGR